MKRFFALFLTLMIAVCVTPSLKAQLYDLVVAKDGTGRYSNIQDAVNAIRDYKPEGRQRILVKKGVYEEKLVIPSYKTNITLVGEDRDSTIIVWHDHGKTIDAAGRELGTFRSYTMLVNGPGFECENMTISNDAMTHYNPNWWNDRKNNAGVAQAVAVHIEGDRAVFRNCRLLGFQDTMFNGNEDSRQLFYNCYIEGTVDYIFGPATCWFENCEMHCLGNGYVTAASTPAHHPYGYVFNHCTITADSVVTAEWLGRPWRNYAAVLFMNCELPDFIRPLGWHNWGDKAREKTARYAEYHCTGPGADRSKRAAWTRELTDADAKAVTLDRVFAHEANVWQSNVWPISFQEATAPFRPADGKKTTVYAAGTLDAEPLAEHPETEIEPLVICTDKVDCTTFVEYVCATLLGRTQPCATDSIYRRFVQGLRYRDGKRGNYATRLHYFSDWIANNASQFALTEITATLPAAKTLQKQINFMTRHTDAYPQLRASDSLCRAIREVELRLSATPVSYIPNSKIAGIYESLKAGDVVAFVTDTPGLDIQHVGFVDTDAATGRTNRLLHASSKSGHVEVADKTIADYAKSMKHCIGIRIVRLNY